MSTLHSDEPFDIGCETTSRAPFVRPPLMSRIALGGYPLGGGYGSLDDAEARRTVDAALDNGWTFVDTAESYLESEGRLGRILSGRRDRVFLATKVFPCEPFTFDNLRRALDSSLSRLKTDRVDLYQLHGPEDWVVRFRETPWDEIGSSLRRLQDSGKALRFGVCNLTVPQIRELMRHVSIFSTQNLYSIIDRGAEPDALHLPVESEVLPFAAANAMAFLAYSPLSRGLLSDDLRADRTFPPDDERHFLPRYGPDAFPHYVALAHSLQEWANDHGHSLVQLAIAWTLSRPAVAATLVGAKHAAQVEAVAGAEEWSLTPDDMGEIDAIVAGLPEAARQAKMVVWDHFPPEVLGSMAQRRAT